jgi:CRISPR-associated protein Csx14
MTMPPSDITLDLNLRNPGQFFACCGVLELANQLWPGSEGWFAGQGSRGTFNVATHSGHNDPLSEIVRELCDAEDLVAIAPDDGVEDLQADRQPIDLLPFRLRLDWWLDSYSGADKSELKVWAGQQTPVRNINGLRQAWRDIRSRASEECLSHQFFRERWPMKGRFGFDPSASWEALDVGFSPDEQDIPVQTSPATEILAAIGLQRCRPAPIERKRRWFSYRPWETPLDIIVVPVAIVGAGQPGAGYEFPVVMRNAQYGSFGWAKSLAKGE